jgi:hypothetical protein
VILSSPAAGTQRNEKETITMKTLLALTLTLGLVAPAFADHHEGETMNKGQEKKAEMMEKKADMKEKKAEMKGEMKAKKHAKKMKKEKMEKKAEAAPAAPAATPAQ